MADLRLLLLFLVLFVGASACKVEDLNDPIVIPVLDEEFTLDLWEYLGQEPASGLAVRLSSTTEQPCLNTTVLSRFERVSSLLSLTLFDIAQPEVCDPGIAPATGEERLDGVEIGIFTLEVAIRDIVTNTGKLIITPNYYQVQMNETAGIKWLHTELRRVPANTLWGFLTYTTPAQRDYAALWLNNNVIANSQSMTLVDGYYGHYEVTNGGTALHVQDMPASGAIPFIVRYVGDSSAIDTWVADFRAGASGGQTLVVKDAVGRIW